MRREGIKEAILVTLWLLFIFAFLYAFIVIVSKMEGH